MREMNLPTIALMPLDGRPVCYDLPKQLADMAGINLQLPPRECLGVMKDPADNEQLLAWVNELLVESHPAHWLVALDTLVYGGLIASRQGDEPLNELLNRWQQWVKVLDGKNVHGFASILRLPNYNNAEEEPEYWADYGARLHQLSVMLHRDGMADGQLLRQLPEAVWRHFLATRSRNRAMVERFVEAAVPNEDGGVLTFLVLCEDDTGEWGLNRLEAEQLTALIVRLGATARRQTGADEVASTLLVKTVLANDKSPVIGLVYTNPDQRHTILKFDGISVEQLVKQQVAACGGLLAESLEEAELLLYCVTPLDDSGHTTYQQGDHCDGEPTLAEPDYKQRKDIILAQLERLAEYGKPVIIGDVAYANGSDSTLLKALSNSSFKPAKPLIGYGGWNTPGNAMGTALAMGCLYWFAYKDGRLNEVVFKQALLTRFVDDGLYQSRYRHELDVNGTFDAAAAQALTTKMTEDIKRWVAWCGLPDTTVTLSFPCQRRFEVAVHLE